jgi:hypothetical protein
MIAKTKDGKAISVFWPTEGTKTTLFSHDWCNPTTWYSKATRVVDETATCANPGTYTQYQASHANLIDSYHGKITDEDTLKDSSNNSFRVVVKVNGVAKTEADPDDGGNDYSVNYDTGVITLSTALTVDDVVLVTYHYANEADFVIKPSTGKKLKIKSAEAQFSKDVVLNDTVIFEVVVAGNVVAKSVYKSMQDYINAANGAYPVIPAMGGSGWRGSTQECITLPWNYQSLTDLKSSIAMEIRIKLARNRKFGGKFATAAFYCLEEPET